MYYLSRWNVRIVMDLRDLHPRPEIEEKNESGRLDVPCFGSRFTSVESSLDICTVYC